VKASLELGRRLAVLQPEERTQIRSPGDAAKLVMLDMSFLQQEHLRVILLDTKNHVIHIERVYQGSVNMSVVRTAEVFRAAVSRNSPSVIIVHNHPSGDPTPSPEDVRTTEQLVQAGKCLDIDVLDHLIIGHQRFISMKERKLGFS
jgi:DNA repair protein RadC